MKETRKTTVLTAFNEKGGCCKTSIITTLAAGLTLKGYRVVLVDADAQGQAGLAFGLAKEPAFYDLVVRRAAWKDVLRPIAANRLTLPDNASDVKGQLFVVPSNVETRSIADNISDALAVFNRVHELDGHVDFVLFDTSPSPSLLHSTIYFASDWVIYPTLCETWSFDGLKESMAHRQTFDPFRVNQGLAPIQVAGVIPCRYQVKPLEHRENLAKLRQWFGELTFEPIHQATVWTEAASARRAIFGFDPTTRACEQAWGMVNRLEATVYERV